MRRFIFAAIGFGLTLSTLPTRTIHAQNDGGIARLSSAAYAPDSPVRENKLFQYQTGHYGFAYNCDGEECKRNNPAICWQRADQPQLPRRMGFFERVRHEAGQVSRRILDGMCESGCEACQQRKRQSVTQSCGCVNCLAGKANDDSSVDVVRVANSPAIQSQESIGSLATGHLNGDQAAIVSIASAPPLVSRRRSGLISLKPLAPAALVELNPGEVLVGTVEILPAAVENVKPAVEFVQPPVARITSASVDAGSDSIDGVFIESSESDVEEASPPLPSVKTQQMSLVERLKRAQSAQASNLSKPAKF